MNLVEAQETKNIPNAVVHVDLDGAPHIYRAHGWRYDHDIDPLFASGLTNLLAFLERNKLKAIKERLTLEIRNLVVHGLPPDNPLTQAQGLVVKILELEIELSALLARSGALKKVVSEYQRNLESLPDKQVQLARLERNRKVDENLYMMMREKYEESRTCF